MARLVLINGAPGSGKSTLAQMYADEHPLVLALDIDVVRGMLGCRLDEPIEAGLIARRVAIEMARVHLVAGRDVVVPQFHGRLDFVLELERLCAHVGAEFVEVVLLSSPQDAIDRFLRRSRDPGTVAHRDAQTLLERSGEADELPAMYERLLKVVARRPHTRTLMTVDGACPPATSPAELVLPRPTATRAGPPARRCARWRRRSGSSPARYGAASATCASTGSSPGWLGPHSGPVPAHPIGLWLGASVHGRCG